MVVLLVSLLFQDLESKRLFIPLQTLVLLLLQDLLMKHVNVLSLPLVAVAVVNGVAVEVQVHITL